MKKIIEILENGGLFPTLAYNPETQGFDVSVLLWGLLATALAAYLIGSINGAVIISRTVYHDDIRKYGSKNAGMTNMIRVFGTKAGLLTLAIDIVKTAVAVLLGSFLLGGNRFFGLIDFNQVYGTLGFSGAYIAGFMCMVGHTYPLWFGFRGGKGVIAAATTILFINPLIFVIVVLLWFLILWGTKYMSVAVLISAMVFPLLVNRLEVSAFSTEFAFTIAAFIIFNHRSNISRLLKQKENKFDIFGKSKIRDEEAARKLEQAEREEYERAAKLYPELLEEKDADDIVAKNLEEKRRKRKKKK